MVDLTLEVARRVIPFFGGRIETRNGVEWIVIPGRGEDLRKRNTSPPGIPDRLRRVGFPHGRWRSWNCLRIRGSRTMIRHGAFFRFEKQPYSTG